MIEAELHSYLTQHQPRHLDQLKEWLRIPSISTLPEHRQDVAAAASWLVQHLERLGIEHSRTITTDGHPLVAGDWLHAGADRPTVLLYGHFDVQPVDPLGRWQSPPFTPTIRGDSLIARGASDDKGQLFALLTAVEAMLAVRGRLPVNLKLLIEGEEEIGGTSIAAYLPQHRDELSADVCLIADTPIVSPEQPSITYGLRGIWGCEVVVRGPRDDLHSGCYGGVVHNPVQALTELLASLHEPSGRIAVPGFYDDVAELGDEERALLAKVPHGADEIRRETGVPELYGEPGFTPVERIGARPTLEINGIWGGFSGHGFKTVIPAEAGAKISCRLVPNQDPQRVAQVVKQHLQRHCPATVRLELSGEVMVPAALVPLDAPALAAARQAYELGFGVAPLLTREGGGIPIVTVMQEQLGAQVILMGFGLPDDNAHGPNERLHLPNLYRGIRTTIHFLDELAGSYRQD